MQEQLQQVIERLPSPYICMAGHTMGYFDKKMQAMFPLIPPYTTERFATVSSMLRIGNLPEATYAAAAQLSTQLPHVYLSTILNDTTGIPGKPDELPDNAPNPYRAQLVERFSETEGLPHIYQDVLRRYRVEKNRVVTPVHDGTARFWQESSLRDRFDKLIQKKENTDFFADKVARTFNEGRRWFDFRNTGRLNYCQLSPEPNSITGGPDCVAEIVEWCLEVFGDGGVLPWKNGQIEQARFAGGTAIVFTPAICSKPVTEGLRFYKEHFGDNGFEGVAIFCEPDFQSQLASGELNYFSTAA